MPVPQQNTGNFEHIDAILRDRTVAIPSEQWHLVVVSQSV